MEESSAAPRWPADQIERRAVAGLIPHARNARRHTAAQVAEIAGLIREWGWTVPVLIDEADGIIAGHGRVLAAQQLGIADIPVVVARGWSDAQKRAYMIADNEIALHSTWNKELLRVELADLQSQGLDLTTIGFGALDLAQQQGSISDLPQAVQLEPPREYAVIMCADADEWERLKVALNLIPVRRGGYKKGSPLDDVGTQRVVPAADVLRLIER
jgi:ParB-like chromosome segregation protein Spo0J